MVGVATRTQKRCTFSRSSGQGERQMRLDAGVGDGIIVAAQLRHTAA